ncbi:MAG: hypothetical protein ACK5CA_06675 [Cyanobacteriota bacterium]|jgi:hypothetical protein
MAKLTRYRQIIEKILTEYRDWAVDSNQVGEKECIAFDPEADFLEVIFTDAPGYLRETDLKHFL